MMELLRVSKNYVSALYEHREAAEASNPRVSVISPGYLNDSIGAAIDTLELLPIAMHDLGPHCDTSPPARIVAKVAME
jgi:hypothetical protein